jgi:hypothetical protein
MTPSRLFTLAAVLVACAASTAHAQGVWVNPYTRQDGSSVPGHHRSAPNDSRLDNWSSQGNVNPWTGKSGTVDPYATPSYPSYSTPNYGTGSGSQSHRNCTGYSLLGC